MDSQNKVFLSDNPKLQFPSQATLYDSLRTNLKVRRGLERKSGHWTDKQNAKYCAFLQKFKQKFSQKTSRRQWKVFKILSRFISTRNADQCRSHHHKMKKNLQSTDQILNVMMARSKVFRESCSIYIQQLKQIESQIFIDAGPQLQSNVQSIAGNNQAPIQSLPKKTNVLQNMKTETSYQENHLADLPPSQGLKQFAATFCHPMAIYEDNMQEMMIRNTRTVDSEKLQHLKQLQLKTKITQCHQSFMKWYLKAACLFYWDLAQNSTVQK